MEQPQHKLLDLILEKAFVPLS